MKSRKITNNEINRITKKCSPREKAIFTIIRQSGLLPIRIKQLRIKNVERILEPDLLVPRKISISHEKYPTFIGQEAINYLKEYLDKRARKEKLTSESLLFTARNNPSKEIDTKSVSRAFKDNAGKSSELQLKSLIEFYKTNTKDYQNELKELNNDNTPKPDEFYRELYEEKARPSLEIEPPTPVEMHRLKKQQQELENKLRKIEDVLSKEQKIPTPKYWEETEKQHEEHEKYKKEHPEEAKQIEEQERAHEEQDIGHYIAYLEDRIRCELEKKLKELENIIREPKTNRKR